MGQRLNNGINLMVLQLGLMLLATFTLAASATATKQTVKDWVSETPTPGAFALLEARLPVLLVDRGDEYGVVRVATDLQGDIERVSGRRPLISMDAVPKGANAIIVGTIGKSRFIDQLISSRKLNLDSIKGKWESYALQVIENPLPGVKQALVIAGSDKRGTIFGTYELSQRIGVSPWYWWADVPTVKHKSLYVSSERLEQDSPKVKYRGIFINDEGPSLSNWVYANFGEYHHKFYEHVFELLLRLKANYLWPAMWNNCFSQDDPLNMITADQFGIVMGTSHVEPMMRADKEWNRLGYSQDDWNYLKKPKELEDFWRDGVRRNKPYESITTIAMRGKIDTPMSETANISLLESIVKSQRQILAEEVNPDVTKIPQLWALYKEVQEYYEKGMRVPDDVTLLWCDDNWGNIRRLPTAEERNRSGRAGVYYHFDYVGDPRNYKWLNTNPLPKIWEQMTLADAYGADQIWIVNVGDIKPMELPASFFLTMAWDPKGMDVTEFTQDWATRQFGTEFSGEISSILSRYGKYAARRKPELLEPGTYSLQNYDEADRVLREWKDLESRATTIGSKLEPAYQSSYFQLVLHPIKAMRTVTELYIAAAKNRLYAAQGRSSASEWAEKAKSLFEEDKAITKEYHSINGGKWNHFMDQTHIGYTTWQQPDQNNMPQLSTVEIKPGNQGFGIAIEGGDSTSKTLLSAEKYASPPQFTVFSKGTEKVVPSCQSSVPWAKVSALKSDSPFDTTFEVNVDWTKVPAGAKGFQIKVTAGSQAETLEVPVRTPFPARGYTEARGYVAMEPTDYRKIDAKDGSSWKLIQDYGRTSSGLRVEPLTAPSVEPGKGTSVEFEFSTDFAGDIRVQTVTSPTIGFQPKRGIKLGVSIDDGPIQVVDVTVRYQSNEWQESVRTNTLVGKTSHSLKSAPKHTLKIWHIDPGIVVQRILIDMGGLKPSYLGPPESMRVGNK